MKYIVAVIKPHMLEEVRSALAGIGVEGLSVSEIKGHGRQKGHTEVYREAEYRVNFLPKLKLEIAVDSELAERVVGVLATAGRTGQIGDGKVFVLPLESAVRIRTGETGPAAL